MTDERAPQERVSGGWWHGAADAPQCSDVMHVVLPKHGEACQCGRWWIGGGPGEHIRFLLFSTVEGAESDD